MQLKIQILAATSILVTLLSAAYLPMAYSTPGYAVIDPGNVWEPYGPRASSLLLKYFSGEGPEFTAFENGELDFADWPVPISKFAQYESEPDFVLTPSQGEFGDFLLDINSAPEAVWTSWGCDFEKANSACGIEIRQALAHLVDRPKYVTDGPLQGAGQALVDASPPAKDPAGSSLATQNSWDTLHVTNGAFNIAPDSGGFATIRNGVPDPDLCAARDHMIAAGVGFLDANNDCVIDNPGVAVANPIIFVIRDDDVNRRTLGDGLRTSIITLFGGANVVNRVGVIGTAGARAVGVFNQGTEANPSAHDWDIYTGGWILGSPFVDHFTGLYISEVASDRCGNPDGGDGGLNYALICVDAVDDAAIAAALTDDIPTYRDLTVEVFDVMGQHVANIPVYSPGRRAVALRDAGGFDSFLNPEGVQTFGGMVNQIGAGYTPTGGGFATLNARDNPSYSPLQSKYTFGGGSSTLRIGQRAGTSTLNMFHASSYWDFYVLNQIYEGLIATSPVEPAKVISWMARDIQTEFANVFTDIDGDGLDDFLEDTVFTFTLRENLFFQDGQPVTAEDFKFSFDNYLNVPAENLASNLVFYIDSTVISPIKLQVRMVGRSISHLISLGLPVIPQHLWDTNNDDIADPDKTADEFDPMVAGILIGSAAFVCRSQFAADLNTVGTGCATSAAGTRLGGVIGSGASVFLNAYDRTAELGAGNEFVQYMRSYNSAWPAGGSRSGQFQEFSWADKDNNGIVDSVDLSAVAQCVGSTATTGPCGYWNRLGAAGVGAGAGEELVVVASHLDDTWVQVGTEIAWTQANLLNLTPSCSLPSETDSSNC